MIKKHDLTKSKLEEDETLMEVVADMQERTGLSLRKVAEILEINRERVGSVMSILND